jgi:hypothetical protein
MTKTIKELKADVKKADANVKAKWFRKSVPQVEWDAAWEARYAAREALSAALEKGEKK